MFKTITIKNKDYKCVLSASSCVMAEDKLGKNPISIFMTNGELPKLGDILVVFWASLQKFNHNISLADCYDLYDDYIEDGNTLVDFTQVVMEIFTESGFAKKEEDEVKNA